MSARIGNQTTHSGGLARGGVLSFIGAASSAVLGFLLTLALARFLGASGAGVVMQTIALFAIALSFARAGMDSTAIWLLPRLAATHAHQVRGALVFLVVAALITSTVFALLGAAISLALGVEANDANTRAVAQTVDAIVWALPCAALLLVVLSATRSLGSVTPYVAIGGIGLPAARLTIVTVVAALGSSLGLVAVGWAAPLPAALIAAAIVLHQQLTRHEKDLAAKRRWWPSPETRQSIRNYAVPRMLSAGLEQALLWIDVLIVGAVLGSVAAGIYGGASRFIAAGLIVDNAIRVVVSPQFSVLFAQRRIAELQRLYRTAARWLVLFSTPIYLVLAIHAPIVLSWLGPEFADGATALALLSAGAIVTLMAGNIHSVLLMSGRSGWAAFNKAVVLIVNVAGNLLLLPLIGITGAAISWALSMLIDAGLATIEVRRLVGIRIEVGSVIYAALIPLVTIGAPAIIMRLLWGSTLLTLILSLAVGTAAFLSWCFVDAKRLELRQGPHMFQKK